MFKELKETGRIISHQKENIKWQQESSRNLGADKYNIWNEKFSVAACESRFEQAEERTYELKDRSIEIIQVKGRKKRVK